MAAIAHYYLLLGASSPNEVEMEASFMQQVVVEVAESEEVEILPGPAHLERCGLSFTDESPRWMLTWPARKKD